MDQQQSEIIEAAKRFVSYFKPVVLAQYLAEPHKYEVEASDFDGRVRLRSSYSEGLSDDVRKAESINIRFGYRKTKDGEYCLAVFTPDFPTYSDGHVERWMPYNISAAGVSPLPDLRFEAWAQVNLLGSWDVEANVFDRLYEQVRLINALTMEGFDGALFQVDKNPNLHAPIGENTRAYEDAHREAYVLLIDGLEPATISELIEATGVETKRADGKTVQRLKSAFPDATTLWHSLELVSENRRRATHKVRPEPQAFAAFDTFCKDLEGVVAGLVQLRCQLESIVGASAEEAMHRQTVLGGIPDAEGPAHPSSAHIVSRLEGLVGKTIESVRLLQRRQIENVHRSEILVLCFTDKTVAHIETWTNACNVSSDHGDFDPAEFDVTIYAHVVPPPITK